MDKTPEIWAYRNDAKWRLRRAAEHGGCHTFDLLGSGARRPIIESLTAPDVARNVFGMRQASMQDRWRALVGLAADNTYALGFRRSTVGSEAWPTTWTHAWVRTRPLRRCLGT